LEELSSSIRDRQAFILENTRLLRPPMAPGLELYLADEAVALWQKTEDELGRIGLPPPFWAFAWAGGQAIAAFLAERPGTVAGKFVLDFASGSGLVAIAAAKAGAARVEASEIDEFALTAIEMNARGNGVTVEVRSEDLVGSDDGWDVVLAGDISYQRDMAEPATAWLEGLTARGADVLIGDPGRAYLALDRLECVAEYRVPVTRALEDAEIKRSVVYRFRTAAAPASSLAPIPNSPNRI
jgi:predicted nicotinamide N-methyase